MTTATMNWADGPLHKALVNALPAFVKEPFSENPKLNIPRLKDALGKSHETIYKWLRSSKLRPCNLEQLILLANSDENLAVLSKMKRKAPKREDFSRFLFS